jgi:hypothetical protein
MDEHLLAALAVGMPDCAGVASASTDWSRSRWASASPQAMAFTIDNA